MATTRVHLLATELGVKSKAIIDKCQAEGLDSVKNHMSTISAGLAATIREWFSEGEHSTAVEESERVDLDKVRVKRKRKKDDAVAADESAAAEFGEADLIDEEAPAEAQLEVGELPAVEPEAPSASEPVAQEPEPVAPEVPPQPQEPQPVSAPEPQAVVPEEPKPEPEKKPEPVMPAGPMLEKPKPAQLSGPRVVRVEAPEPQRPMRGPKPRPPMAGQRPPGSLGPRPAGAPGQRPYGAPGQRPVGAPGAGPRRFDKPFVEPAAPVIDDGKKKPAAKDKHGRKHEGSEEDKKNKLLKMRERDFEERRARLEAAGGENMRLRPVRKIENKHQQADTSQKKIEKVNIFEPITVKDLAAALGLKHTDIITKLMKQGIMANANQSVSTESAELIAIDFGVELVIQKRETPEETILRQFQERSRDHLERRSPVVTVLGHVDHGKTSLLDKIRKANVAAGEAGGITQHIGAYQVNWGDKKVTFLDTPGHEAFTEMRARGANMTDVVVLVVAADDGVMPQTIEAIHHAKAANVPIIVALNKIDLPGVDINRIYGQLAEHELVPTEWGGKTEVVKTSAVTGLGVQELLEYLDYTSELLELKADSTIPATGYVVEAKMTANQGPVATILVKEGILSKGDVILAGPGYGRIRTIKDSMGRSIKEAVSSMPVEISGLSDVPQAGDRFYCLEDINKAKMAAEENQALSREKALARRSQITLDNLFTQIAAGAVKELNLIIRADVQGSVDVLIKYISDMSTDEVKTKILHAGVGGVTEGDVVLAEASNAIIIGFNAVADETVRQLAEAKGVDIRFYNIIYRITEDLKKAMSGLLEPEQQEKVIGRAQVRNTFKISSVGTIAGCYVTSGIVNKNAKVRLIRNNVVVKGDIKLDSLKHFKDDAKEVKAGLECGIKLAGYDDIKLDDVLEFYDVIEVARTL